MTAYVYVTTVVLHTVSPVRWCAHRVQLNGIIPFVRKCFYGVQGPRTPDMGLWVWVWVCDCVSLSSVTVFFSHVYQLNEWVWVSSKFAFKLNILCVPGDPNSEASGGWGLGTRWPSAFSLLFSNNQLFKCTKFSCHVKSSSRHPSFLLPEYRLQNALQRSTYIYGC